MEHMRALQQTNDLRDRNCTNENARKRRTNFASKELASVRQNGKGRCEHCLRDSITKFGEQALPTEASA